MERNGKWTKIEEYIHLLHINLPPPPLPPGLDQNLPQFSWSSHFKPKTELWRGFSSESEASMKKAIINMRNKLTNDFFFALRDAFVVNISLIFINLNYTFLHSSLRDAAERPHEFMYD